MEIGRGNIVRVSIGRFDTEKIETIRQALGDTYDKLEPGIKAIKGNLGFYAGIDEENYAMVNVSTWESIEAAKQMEDFQPMLDLAKEFVQLGVRFERPILNFAKVWAI